jgi:quercetin dioxygenase-like cupin family protein
MGGIEDMPKDENVPDGELSGRVVDLAELVDYQAGAVVSRTLIKKPTGTVTLFAFDAGEGLSEHSTPHDALVLGLEGRLDVTVGGEPHEVDAGDALMLPANVPHALRALTPTKMLLTMLREHP